MNGSVKWVVSAIVIGLIAAIAKFGMWDRLDRIAERHEHLQSEVSGFKVVAADAMRGVEEGLKGHHHAGIERDKTQDVDVADIKARLLSVEKEMERLRTDLRDEVIPMMKKSLEQ